MLLSSCALADASTPGESAREESAVKRESAVVTRAVASAHAVFATSRADIFGAKRSARETSHESLLASGGEACAALHEGRALFPWLIRPVVHRLPSLSHTVRWACARTLLHSLLRSHSRSFGPSLCRGNHPIWSTLTAAVPSLPSLFRPHPRSGHRPRHHHRLLLRQLRLTLGQRTQQSLPRAPPLLIANPDAARCHAVRRRRQTVRAHFSHLLHRVRTRARHRLPAFVRRHPPRLGC
eukprot:6198927-Pleurochrysis_carterae.AAC.1